MKIIKIDKLTKEDIPDILTLWKEQGDVLGIPFRSTINKLINNGTFLCIRNKKELIAMCGYNIMKRCPEIRITKLCVRKSYRNRGLATALIRHILNITSNLKLDVYAECKDGAENNNFYDKFGNVVSVKECKTMRVRKYKLNKRLFYIGETTA